VTKQPPAGPPAAKGVRRPARPSSAELPSSPIATVPLPILVGSAAGLVALGFLIGAGGSFLQARTVGLGVRWPVGAVFSVLVLGAVGFSASLITRSRLGLGVVTAGWLVSVLLFTAGRPEGDVIIAADLPGYAYLFGGVLILGALSALPYSALPTPSSE
jgi:hypothetical protein